MFDMTRTIFAACLALTTALALPDVADAQAGAGALRLGADLNVLGITHYPDPDAFNSPDPNVYFGIYNAAAGIETVGFFAPSIGYMITDDLLIGAHFGLAAVSFSGMSADATDVGFGIHIVAAVEYLFGQGDIRPFIGGQVGPRIIATPQVGSDVEVNFVAGALGGVHIFATDGFSISPFGNFNFLYYSGYERAGYEFVLGVALEGWIGGSSSNRGGGGGGGADDPEGGAY